VKEGVNRFSNLKDLQIVIGDKRHDVDIRQPEFESRTAVGKASSGKGKGEWRTYLAHFLLIS